LSINQKNKIFNDVLNKLEKENSQTLYQTVYVDYKRFSLKNLPISLYRKIEILISDLWWNFGFKKERILIITLSFIFFFTICLQQKIEKYFKVYRFDSLKKRLRMSKYSSHFQTAIYRYLIALIYVTLIFFDLRINFDKLNFKYLCKSFIILFIYVFGKVCTAFIITYIITL